MNTGSPSHRYSPTAVVSLLLILGSVGCDGPETEKVSDRIPPLQPTASAVKGDVPVESCFDSAVGRLALAEVAAVVAQGFPTAIGSEDPTWTPGRIVDLEIGHEGLYVLDGQANEIYWMSSNLERRRKLVTEGPGPNEALAPRSIAVGPNYLWVLDARKDELIGYDLSGTQAKMVSLPRKASEMAADGEGRIYLTTQIPRKDIRLPGLSREQSEEQFQKLGQTGVLLVMNPASGTIDSVSLRQDRRQGERPLIEPYWTEVKLRPLPGGVAVVYPNANWVDVYEGGDIQRGPRSLVGCWPEELAKFYQVAREQVDESESNVPSQRTVPLISDVYRRSNGEYVLLSNVATEDNLYHLDVFTQSGAEAGSYIGRRRLIIPVLSRLASDGGVVFGAMRNGTIVKLRVARK